MRLEQTQNQVPIKNVNAHCLGLRMLPHNDWQYLKIAKVKHGR
jgi:hypothetical protein